MEEGIELNGGDKSDKIKSGEEQEQNKKQRTNDK